MVFSVLVNRFDLHNNNSARASPFFYISFPCLHDYDLQMLNFTFYGGRKQAMTKFSFFLWTPTPGEFAYFWQSKYVGRNNHNEDGGKHAKSRFKQGFRFRRRPQILRSLKSKL